MMMIFQTKYQIYWRFFTVLVLILIYFHLIRLYYHVSYRQSTKIQPSENISITIEICYKLDLSKETCKATVKNGNQEKTNFECDFQKPISCYTKGFKKLNPKEIIAKLKECQIQNLTNVESESEQTVKLDRNEYEIFEDHICVKSEFKVFNETESKIKIYPVEKNKQIFHVLIHTSRAHQNQPLIFSSIKSHLLERYCWILDDSNNTYKCTDNDKEIDFELLYFTQKRLQFPYDSDCLYRDGIDQRTCFENCVKKHTNYYILTYKETDLKPLTFDHKSAKSYFDECTLKCSQPDCLTGTFQLPILIEKNSSSQNFISIKIENQDKPTEAKYSVRTSRLLYAASVFFCLFFGINFYDGFIRATNLYNNPVKKSKKRKLITNKRILHTFVFQAGILLAIFFEIEFFNFGNEKKMIFSRLDSVKERNVSVSICFDLCSILKDESFKENCTEQVLVEKLDLRTLDQITWDINDFKKVSSMRNSVRVVPIRQKDYEIDVFYREFKKCFLLFYPAKNFYPPISLQRKSQLHLNSSGPLFTYFYIEDGLNYPQIDAMKNKTSFLHNVFIEDYNNLYCVNYDEVFNGTCKTKDECIQNCILDYYLMNEIDKIPIFVNLKMNENITDEYLNSKFDNNEETFKQALEKCKLDFNQTECYTVKTRLRTKYVDARPHNISVTLTPKIFYTHRTKNEDVPVIINRILSFFIILTGISIKDIAKGFISIYFCLRRSSLYRFQLINRIAYLIVFLLFLFHSIYLICIMICAPMDEVSYRQVLQKIVLPRIRLCYEIEQDLSLDKFNKLMLDEKSLNITAILESISILDQNREKIKMKTVDLRSNNSLVTFYEFYIDQFKCFNFDFNIEYNTLNTNILESNELVTFVLKLEKVPKKRFFIYLNAKSMLDFEWYKPFETGYVNILYVIEDFLTQDDFWILKNFRLFIKSLFGLEKLKNTPSLYYAHLRDVFFEEQYVTTTVVPINEKSKKDATIRNLQFNSYIHFRSLSGNRNDYDFNTNNRKYSFMSDFISEESYLGKDRLVISLRSVWLKLKMQSTNKYKIVELILQLFILTTFYFKFDFIDLPVHLKNAYPVLKFFVIAFLYFIVLLILFLYETIFKFIRFLDFKYAS